MLTAVSCLFQLAIIKTKATTDERKEGKKKKKRRQEDQGMGCCKGLSQRSHPWAERRRDERSRTKG